MRGIDRRRVVELALLVSATVAGASCAHMTKGFRGPQITYPLVVHNRSEFEVVVYAVPSVGGSGLRLGNARSLSTTTMTVPRNALQGTDVLVVKLHGIGSARASRSWTSQGASIDSGVVAQLDIRSDPYGGLSKSALYTEVASIAGHKYR